MSTKKPETKPTLSVAPSTIAEAHSEPTKARKPTKVDVPLSDMLKVKGVLESALLAATTQGERALLTRYAKDVLRRLKPFAKVEVRYGE